VESDREAVAGALRSLLSRTRSRATVGICVLDAATGERWFAQESDEPLKPASVLKLFTTAAALERFGPSFALRTRAYLAGDELWIIGGGDPGPGDERLAGRRGTARDRFLAEIADGLKAAGVSALSAIVLDDSVFDQQWRHEDWPDDQAQSWYQAPIGALNYNDNCVDARVAAADGAVRLTLIPELPAGFVRNELGVGRKHAPAATRALDSDVFEFRGTVARGDELGPVAAGRPTVFFGHAVREALSRRGITVQNVVRRVIADVERSGARLVATHETSLTEMLWRCNTFSQNLFAECLIKALGAYAADGRRTATGGWENGARVVQTTLSGLGIELGAAALRDGSGLSDRNRVTAGQVAALLVRMHGHRHAAVFADSLARPGQEGTMRRRYAEPALVQRLRGKTGTIRSVRTLAGYATRPGGTELAFAVLINGDGADELLVQVARVLVGAP
jgi:D-alanyl-D-alanine carboxypeptidase/D-alanyl-D-alanine-endopeptidase (penicillin-binding protein 4)